jgi:hypothetical protein
LSEVDRPQKTRQSGPFSLIPFGAEVLGLPLPSNVTPEDIAASWLTPIEACAYAARIVGTEGASNAIWQLLKAGMIQAAAVTSSMTKEGFSPHPKTEPSLIPPGLWRHFSDSGSDLWNGGYARFWMADRRGGAATVFQYFQIRFNPADVRNNLPPLPAPTPEPAPATPTVANEVAPQSKGGRPRKDWWDDFWIDICGQIYEGTLKPNSQADLQRAMHEWVGNHGHDAGETTIKTAARKLFKAWKLGIKN